MSWPGILERLMKLQSAAFFFAMLIGAACYDSVFMTKLCSLLGWNIELSASTTLRFPLYLNLITALIVLWVTLRMREVSNESAHKAKATLRQATFLTWQTGKWIISKPLVWILILITLSYDSIIRMFLTLNSQYYRSIHLPEVSLGIMGALMAVLGLITPSLAKKAVVKYSIRTNFILLGIGILAGLWGLSLVIPWWGIVPAMVVSSGMYFLNFFTSTYLNRAVDSERRATALSFKGLACNLAYGGLGILYMYLTQWLSQDFQRQELPESATLLFNATLVWFHGFFLIIFCLLIFIGWKRLHPSSP